MTFKICFYGLSGAGKTTAYTMAAEYLWKTYQLDVTRFDVAEPLRRIQQDIYESLKLGYPGYVDSDTFKQDGKLLSFLATNYEGPLQTLTHERLDECIRMKFGAIINADCRNNMYPILATYGFQFVKIEVTPALLILRRKNRGDLSKYDYNQAVEQIDKIPPNIVITNNGTFEGLKEQVEAAVKTLYKEQQELLKIKPAEAVDK